MKANDALLKGLKLNKPADPKKLTAFLKLLPFALPEDYIDFLRLANGAAGEINGEFIRLDPFDQIMDASSDDLHLGIVHIGSDGGEDAYSIRFMKQPAEYLRFFRETGRSRKLGTTLKELFESLGDKKPAKPAKAKATKPAKAAKPSEPAPSKGGSDEMREIPRIGVAMALGFSPDGQQLVFASGGGPFGVYSVADLKKISQLKHAGIYAARAATYDATGAPRVLYSFVEHEPKYRGGLRIFDAARGAIVAELTPKGGSSVAAGAFSPDGSRVVYSSPHDLTLHVDAPSGKPLANFPMQSNDPFAIAFSGDGKLLALGCSSYLREPGSDPSKPGPDRKGDVLIYDAAGKRLAEFHAHDDKVAAVCFDGNRHLLTCSKQSAALWEVDKWSKPLARFDLPIGPITSAVWIPNRDQAAIATYPGAIFIVDVSSGAVGRTIKAPMKGAGVIAISTDGSTLAAAAGRAAATESGCPSGIRLWRL